MQRQLVYRIYYLAKLAMTKLQNILILKIWDQKNYGYTSLSISRSTAALIFVISKLLVILVFLLNYNFLIITYENLHNQSDRPQNRRMRHRLYGGVRGSLCKGAPYSIRAIITSCINNALSIHTQFDKIL